ncbi:hypothetical protein L211DRAFT_142456 [Terfezia boudieri ATCC MYA-4762]|uniref:Uncharacterized protein n=1 Tax=Terfezia boudieri ATCC MYA-4762 TaxID=1051890 RepID=A0A3N4LVK9_9PEZI|nr:hypothetical protein L211DRAFT_142456 [Terfezia boudieri ATCC MYA-4762]
MYPSSRLIYPSPIPQGSPPSNHHTATFIQPPSAVYSSSHSTKLGTGCSILPPRTTGVGASATRGLLPTNPSFPTLLDANRGGPCSILPTLIHSVDRLEPPMLTSPSPSTMSDNGSDELFPIMQLSITTRSSLFLEKDRSSSVWSLRGSGDHGDSRSRSSK